MLGNRVIGAEPAIALLSHLQSAVPEGKLKSFTDREIEIFRTVFLTRSISAAGLRLNLSQPSVSRILSEFERKFGCDLFIRKSRGVKPTREAKVFFQEVERRLEVMTSLQEAAVQIVNKERGALLVGANIGLSVSLVPRVLRDMGIAQKSISVKVHTRSSVKVIEYVRAGLIDVGLASSEHQPDGVTMLHDFVMPFFALIPRCHDLADDQSGLELSELAGANIVAPSNDVAEMLRVRRIGQKSSVSLMADTFPSAIATAEAIDAVSIVDGFMAHSVTQKRDFIARPILDMAGLRQLVIVPIASRQSMIAADFIDNLQQNIDHTLSWVAASRPSF
ncbi:MAG TPA: LysR family transcriptional regulator [Roseovarius nubinhibens]|uniref:LysR family transcriptional regulator n=1 Tax=Roseovarius nubinhibens TaxID=314263 RepID=A0A348WCH2_9RHOB|nr:LysR family transcriptional regulator [Roseovarius nubinhibens]|tara:strand:+ start:13194 stop:14195 length:1002 start_codon:yes stop_codon:yes gene_type:complete